MNKNIEERLSVLEGLRIKDRLNYLEEVKPHGEPYTPQEVADYKLLGNKNRRGIHYLLQNKLLNATNICTGGKKIWNIYDKDIEEFKNKK